MVWLAVFSGADRASAAPDPLTWDKDAGVTWRHPVATVCLDRNKRSHGPVLRFLPNGGQQRLTDPTVKHVSPTQLQLTYRVAAPGNVALVVVRCLDIKETSSGVALVETFTLNSSQPLVVDVQVDRSFSLRPVEQDANLQAVLPLKNGWAKTVLLTPDDLRSEYRLGNPLTGKETPQLALPVLQVGGAGRWTGALLADPTFAALFDVRRVGEEVHGSLRYCYAGSRVPVRSETRKFGVWLAPVESQNQPFGASLDTFFNLMLPDVPPAPQWVHKIAMVGYDFLSEDGEGFERDARALAKWLTPEERSHVALCLHGAYDAYGFYAYDQEAGRIKDEWIAFGRTRKVHLTQQQVKQLLRRVRKLGFRVLMHYASGMLADSGMPGYREDWSYRDAQGTRKSGWQGPDTFGPTYHRNAAHPEVRERYLGHMDAVLKAYGSELDGLSFDETFHTRIGQIAMKPEPAYCDRAMLSLVKELTHRVHAFDPEKALFASDCIGIAGWDDIPGYAMVADGSYQDSICHPVAWSYGLFPNWRNVLWSCNWKSVSHFYYTRWGVETFGAPVAITNGYYGDDRGPAEWTPSERDGMLKLFRQRLQQGKRVRFLTEDPVPLVVQAPHFPSPGDPLPAADADTTNWALAANGSRATSSSEESQGYPASGAIDGVRDESGWGNGHGWLSKHGQRLPQWLQVDFPKPRDITQFVVIAYQKECSPQDLEIVKGWENLNMQTAGQWGIHDYEIQVWDAKVGQWKTVVTEARRRAVKVRVHALAAPVRTERFRIVVKRVAPLDEQARLFQLEAWGPADP